MSTLRDLFGKIGVVLYQNESLDLDHYYQEPYQDADADDPNVYEMAIPFETNQSKQKRNLHFDRSSYSNFSYFMDGSRRTYKIGDIILDKTKIYPVVVAQIRAGCGVRGSDKKLRKHIVEAKNLLLVSSRMADSDFEDFRLRITRTDLAKFLSLDVIKYKYDKTKDLVPVNAAIAKANSEMHAQEIHILDGMVHSKDLDPNHMLVVDGPLQFLAEDNGKDSFADLFYDVIGVSKSFDPMLSMSEQARGGKQIGTHLLSLEYGERTPVFRKTNSKGRVFGCWYLRIRPRQNVKSPLEGIIKIEKMAIKDEKDSGFNSDAIDNLSRSLLEECVPTCHGRDDRWAAHLYPIYLTETMIKASFMGDLSFINQFRRNF